MVRALLNRRGGVSRVGWPMHNMPTRLGCANGYWPISLGGKPGGRGESNRCCTVLRGGSWNNTNPRNLRTTNRNRNHPTNRNNNNGFRCAQDAGPGPESVCPSGRNRVCHAGVQTRSWLTNGIRQPKRPSPGVGSARDPSTDPMPARLQEFFPHCGCRSG